MKSVASMEDLDLTLVNLTVGYVNKSSSCHSVAEILVKFRLCETVASLLDHLSASYNGLQSCRSGKELHLLQSKGRTKRIDLYRSRTLESLGVKGNDHLKLIGFRPISKKHYVYPLEIMDPDGQKVSVEVTNTTDMNTLRHKLQNKTGIHASEIVLYCNKKMLEKKGSRITVEFYGGLKKVLKMKYVSTYNCKQMLASESLVSKRNEHLHKDSEIALIPQLPEHSRHAIEVDGLCNIQHPLEASGQEDKNMDISIDSPCKASVTKCKEMRTDEERPIAIQACLRDPDEYLDLSRAPPLPISEQGFVENFKEKFQWEQLAIRLEISSGERQHIQHDYVTFGLESIKLHMFLRWKEKNGTDATWRKLLIAVLEDENKQLADKIIQLARKRKNSDATLQLPIPGMQSDVQPATKRPHLHGLNEAKAHCCHDL